MTRFLEAIRTADVPERVTFEFIKTLGFKSSNDRPIISVLKGIGFLDDNGSPTATYRAYRDHTRGPKVLGKALKVAYADLFLANTKAHELSTDKLKGIIAAKVSKGDAVVKLMASTFKTLAKSADFSEDVEDAGEDNAQRAAGGEKEPVAAAIEPPALPRTGSLSGAGSAFHYNIQIHLPTTTDISVYNAIFKSLREHLT